MARVRENRLIVPHLDQSQVNQSQHIATTNWRQFQTVASYVPKAPPKRDRPKSIRLGRMDVGPFNGHVKRGLRMLQHPYRARDWRACLQIQRDRDG